MRYALILSCEHASNKIPDEFEEFFSEYQDKLDTHSGYDIGAKTIYDKFTKLNPQHMQYASYSRLLIDLNRTRNHHNLFSNISKAFSNKSKQMIMEKYYSPYVNKLNNAISLQIKQGKVVLHISTHSFTPILNDVVRKNDIGFLYDPKRILEKLFCRHWSNNLKNANTQFKQGMNYPYKGTSNGLTSYFRKQFSSESYLGIELEVNQKHILDNENIDSDLSSALYKSLEMTLNYEAN